MTWFDVAAAALLGSTCLGCERPGRPWCAACLEDLHASIDPWSLHTTPPTIACCPYTGVIPEAIVGFKDRNVRSLGPVLADIVALGVAELGQRGVLVPAPSTPAAIRKRGFDHTRYLAERAAQRVGVPWRSLLRSCRRQDQAGLSPARRARNMHGSMRAVAAGSEAVVVIDDVRTSGATLNECARALRQAGYQVLGHAVIASAHG